MSHRSFRIPSVIALCAALLGLALAWLSTGDYAAHLDRQMHDLHCSYVPGGAAEEGADAGCKTALFSPYSALFRDALWGGVPISLFAVGAFAFFGGFALYLTLAGRSAPRRATQFFSFVGLTPLIASIVMATISATVLGEFCKTCVGIYLASIVLAGASIALLIVDRRDIRTRPPAPAAPAPAAGAGAIPPTVVDESYQPRLLGHGAFVLAWLAALGIFSAAPALLYASAVPDYDDTVRECGELEADPHENEALLGLTSGKVAATALVDPLCPTCKGLHQRLETEGALDKLDLRVVLFPLDDECNWMLQQSLHPGACVVSRAVLCADHKAETVLAWAYEHQEEILEIGKGAGKSKGVRDYVLSHHPSLEKCIDDEATQQRLDEMMRFAVDNQLPVSTPQLFLGKRKLCEEDTDLGLAYTLKALAPELQ